MVISFEEIKNFATQKVNHLLDLVIFEITEDIYFFNHTKTIGAIDHLKDIINSRIITNEATSIKIKAELKKPISNLLLTLKQLILDNVENKDKRETNNLLKSILITRLDRIKRDILQEQEDIKYLLSRSPTQKELYIECVLVFDKLEKSRELDDYEKLLNAHIDRKFNISINTINGEFDKIKENRKNLKKRLQEKKYFLKQADQTQDSQIAKDILEINKEINSLTTKRDNIHKLYEEQYAYQQNFLNRKIIQLERKETARYNLILALHDTKTLPTRKSALVNQYKKEYNSFKAQYIDTCPLVRARVVTYEQASIFSLSDLMAYNEALIYNKSAVINLFSIVKSFYTENETLGLRMLASIDFIKINSFLKDVQLFNRFHNGYITLKQISELTYEDLQLLSASTERLQAAFDTIWPCSIPTLKYLISYPKDLINTVLNLDVHTDLRMDNAGTSIADILVLQIDFIKNIATPSKINEEILSKIHEKVINYCVTEILSIDHPNFLPCLQHNANLGNKAAELLEDATRENQHEVAEILLIKYSEKIPLAAKKTALELAKKKGHHDIEILLADNLKNNTYAAILKRNLDTKDFASKELDRKKMNRINNDFSIS
jgi:hypothetical protein